MKICIVGENSKIGKSLIKHLPAGFELVEITKAPDYIFLATASDKAQKIFEQYHSQFKIVDFSGAYKPQALAGQNLFTYAFDPLFDKAKSHVVFPGCSSLAMLTALYPLKDIIIPDSVFADVKFSKSAMQYKSSRQTSVLENQAESVNPFNHFHEKEINQVLSPLQVKVLPSVLNIAQGLFINLFFNVSNFDSVEEVLKTYYQSNSDVIFNGNLKDVLDTNKTSLSVVQENHRVCITIISDNLVNGKVFTFLESR